MKFDDAVKSYLSLGYVKAIFLMLGAVVLLSGYISKFLNSDMFWTFICVCWAVFFVLIIASPRIMSVAIAFGFEKALKPRCGFPRASRA